VAPAILVVLTPRLIAALKRLGVGVSIEITDELISEVVSNLCEKVATVALQQARVVEARLRSEGTSFLLASDTLVRDRL